LLYQQKILQSITVKAKVRLSIEVPCRYIQGVEVQLQSFLTVALDGSKSSASPSCYFTLGECSGIPTRRLGGLQSWSEYFKQKSLLPLLRYKTLIIQSIAQSLY
jgi:hypothetical protein